MNGREENEKKTIAKIENKIKNKPSYVRSFYNTIYDKSYTTQYKYICYVLEFVDYLEKEGYEVDTVNCFKNIKKSTISSYAIQMEVSTGLKRAKLYGVKNFFDYLVDDDVIEYNPCDKIKFPKEKTERQVVALTKKEIKTVEKNILNGCGTKKAKASQKKFTSRDMAIVMMGLSLGLRVTSLSELNIDDINFELNEIRITEKGNKTRYIYISDKLKDVILNWMSDRDRFVKEYNISTNALFLSNKNERLTSIGIYNLVKKYTYNIDKKITPHKLRSTCATNVYNSTGDIYLTANVLGHANIANTRRYAKIDEERKKKVASAMDKILF